MSQDGFVLTNVAAEAGLQFKQNNFATEKKYPFETLGGAVAVLDFDNDGALDLLFLNGSPSPDHLKADAQSLNRLYRNTGKGVFVDVTRQSGLSGIGKVTRKVSPWQTTTTTDTRMFMLQTMATTFCITTIAMGHSPT